jgi:outer membrane protein
MRSKILFVVSLAFLATVLCVPFSWAASPSKMGFFDSLRVATKSKWGEQVAQELKKQGEKLQGDLEQKSKAFKDKRDEFEKKKSMLDEKAKNKQMQDLQSMQMEAEKIMRDSQTEYNRLQEQLFVPMRNKIAEVVKEIGKKDGYDLILEKAAIVYNSDKVDDLTDRVIRELDKVTPATVSGSGSKY